MIGSLQTCFSLRAILPLAQSFYNSGSYFLTAPKCTFPGLVEISLKRFQDSDTQLVECPGCGRTRTLTPAKGILRLKPHEKRKVNTPNTEKRWVKGEPDWDMVGGE